MYPPIDAAYQTFLNATAELPHIAERDIQPGGTVPAALYFEAIAQRDALYVALRRLVAADNCNYARGTTRGAGYFDAGRAALARCGDQLPYPGGPQGGLHPTNRIVRSDADCPLLALLRAVETEVSTNPDSPLVEAWAGVQNFYEWFQEDATA
jgi:hypothetical protein